MSLVLHLVLSVLLILSALAVTRVKDLLAMIALLSVFSGVIAVLYALMGAADVAFTEAVVGTGVSTVFLVILLRWIDPNRVGRPAKPRRVFAMVTMVALGMVLCYGIWSLPDFAEPESATNSHIAPEYIGRAYHDMHTPNVVTAVLADYRSVDTMIETAVVATAALACALIIGRRTRSS